MNINGYKIQPQANLRGADLPGTDLRGANLHGANLRGANLRGANLRGANLRDTVLAEANLTEADLREANLCRATIHETCLRGANLSKANLSQATLAGSDLTDAQLTGATLCSTRFNGANLRWAIDLVELDMVDPRGYRPVAIRHYDGWKIASGCRWFTIDEALEHWGNSRYVGSPTFARRYCRAIEQLISETGSPHRASVKSIPPTKNKN